MSEPAAPTAAVPRRVRLQRMAGTALAYALVGWLALFLAGPPGYASPLYPSAGIALAATLTYGAWALPGVLAGSFSVNLALAAMRGGTDAAAWWLPVVIGFGAALQALVGAWLVRRFAGQPVLLQTPRDVVRAGLLGALLACCVSASTGTAAMLAAGILEPSHWLDSWATWWSGDTLGVLIGAPIALALIGRPRSEWRPRQRTLALPLAVALLLVAAAMWEVRRIDLERSQLAFERQLDVLATDADTRLRYPVHGLEALHGAVVASGRTDDATLQAAGRWWLDKPRPLRALGYSERVARADIPRLEAAAAAEGLAGFRVFQRDDGQALAEDGEAVVLRRIEPRAGNAAALGVNALSIAAARAAILSARDSGEAAASGSFRLTQSGQSDETGVVMYRALYRGPAASMEARRRLFTGVVFVTVSLDRMLAGLSGPAGEGVGMPVWCLFDPSAGGGQRLAGNGPCQAPARSDHLAGTRRLELGGRPLELRAWSPRLHDGGALEAHWLVALTGLAAAAMLGALLLTVTGHSRRTERAVEAGTADLRREIDERQQVEDALRQSEARLRSIVDHAPLGVAYLNPRGLLLEANQRLHEMLGAPLGSLRGRNVLDLVAADDRAGAAHDHRELLAGRVSTVRRSLRMMCGDGSLLHARVAATALRDGAGRVSHQVAVIEDIGEHLRLEAAEQAMQRAEAANRAKSEFVSRMSHELRTPLNAMIGFAQLLALDRERGLDGRQQGWVQHIQRAGWHLLELINDTLDLARIESGAMRLTPEPVELPPLLAACRALVAQHATQRGVQFEESNTPELPLVLADATRLKQVVTNLLSNAVKYNRDGGRVLVQTQLGHDGRVELVVEDSGLGMTDEQLQHLFEPYNRLGRESSGIEGTGIGLVISRRLAELMRGTLEATSRAGVGSRFVLRLPSAEAQPTRPAPATTLETPAYAQRQLLYVEDNETNVEVMRGILLSRPQVRLEVRTLGLDGLEAARRLRPDLILLDMQLPDISGLELLRHLKQDDEAGGIGVIVVSADATPARMQSALTLGAISYVTKPLDVANFLRVLDQALESLDTRWGM
jgi:PAS domain S-box-containing protein